MTVVVAGVHFACTADGLEKAAIRARELGLPVTDGAGRELSRPGQALCLLAWDKIGPTLLEYVDRVPHCVVAHYEGGVIGVYDWWEEVK